MPRLAQFAYAVHLSMAGVGMALPVDVAGHLAHACVKTGTLEQAIAAHEAYRSAGGALDADLVSQLARKCAEGSAAQVCSERVRQGGANESNVWRNVEVGVVVSMICGKLGRASEAAVRLVAGVTRRCAARSALGGRPLCRRADVPPATESALPSVPQPLEPVARRGERGTAQL